MHSEVWVCSQLFDQFPTHKHINSSPIGQLSSFVFVLCCVVVAHMRHREQSTRRVFTGVGSSGRDSIQGNI